MQTVGSVCAQTVASVCTQTLCPALSFICAQTPLRKIVHNRLHTNASVDEIFVQKWLADLRKESRIIFMFLSERIKNLAPANASFFRLKMEYSDGSSRFFPPETGAYYMLGDSPFGIPSGMYVLCFYDKHYYALREYDRSFEMKLQNELHRADPAQVFLHSVNTATQDTLSADVSRSSEARLNAAAIPTPQPAEAHKSEQLGDKKHLTETDVEFQRHMHAMDLEERQQEFIKNSTYVTEVGELFTLNRIMRRELVEMQRLIVQHSQQAYRDIEHVKGVSRDFLQLQKEILASAAENIARPAAPPPDYVGLGHSALSLIKEIGVALISRSSVRESERTLHSGTPVPHLLPHTPEPSPKNSGQAADVIEKIAQKLKSSSDIDIAVAMSSPEKWKALFDDLSASEKEKSGSATVATPASADAVGTAK